MRNCSSAEDLKDIFELYPDPTILDPSDIKEKLTEAKCLTKCQKKQFFLRYKISFFLIGFCDIDFRERSREVHENGDRYAPNLLLTLKSGEDIEELEKEILLFDYWSLFSFIGGFAGLLLGYSMLTLIEILTSQTENLALLFIQHWSS